MKVKLLTVCFATLLLGGCFETTQVGRIEVPRSQVGDLSELPKTTTYIENIYIQYQNKFDVEKAVADFLPKGIIPGVESPMIPLDAKNSQLSSLGFITYISHDGEQAVLTYNDSVLRFQVGENTLFLNDSPGIQIVDAPIYNNTTIYVPIIPILDALKIDYKIEGADLTIGGMYTDGTGDRSTTTITTE